MTTPPVKKDYELAVDAYTAAETSYKALEEQFLSGEVVASIAERCQGDGAKARMEFQSFMEQLQRSLEDMNAKLSTARTALRQAIQLIPSQQRGPGGKATTITYGPFTVSSRTKRWLDAKSLLRLAARYGVLERLLTLTSFNKDGKEYPLVEQVWKIDYENVTKWLSEQNLPVLIDGSYDEKDETPAVSGAKPLAFLGEKIEKT